MKRSKFWMAGRVVGLGLIFTGSVATEVAAKELKWTHYGARPMGMGNAFVAVADDYNALFYNPAGLARINGWTGAFFNLGMTTSQNTFKALKELQDLSAGSQGDDSAVLDFIGERLGENHYFAIDWTPHLIIHGFGMGVGAEFSMRASFDRQVAVNLDFGPKVIAPIAYGHSFWDDKLSLGAGMKFVARGGVDRTFSIDDLSALSSNDSADTSATTSTGSAAGSKLEDFVEGGYGIGFDFGMLFTPIKTMAPTLGLSITDIGGTPYTKMNVAGEALGAPETRLPSVNTGISFKPIQADPMYLLVALDAHAINQPEHYSKKFNLGLEWGYSSIIKLQTGLHQGEWTAGFQFDVKLLKVRFVSYKEQLGSVVGLDDALSDRRFALELKLLI